MSEQILETLLLIASDAAAIVREVYATDFSVDFKAPKDPVTDADRRANALICSRLSQEFPEIPIVAEESAPESFAGYRSAPRVFFVDPLDGTREFIKKNGEFAVMIGLLEEQRPTIGVIHAPALGMAWGGIVGVGAWSFAADAGRQAIRVSDVRELAQARVVASRSHRSKVLEEGLKLLGARRLDPLGSAGLKCAEVACGRAEAYVAPGWAGHRWDMCAGEAIVVAAGGRVSDGRNLPLDYRSESLANEHGVLISNGTLHEAIFERVSSMRPPG